MPTASTEKPAESGPADKPSVSLDPAGSQVSTNQLTAVQEDENLTALVDALRRSEVGAFQFIGDMRTLEAAVNAATNLRRVLNEQGVDVRKMTDEEREAFANPPQPESA